MIILDVILSKCLQHRHSDNCVWKLFDAYCIVHYRSLDTLALLDLTSEVKTKANLRIGLEIAREAFLKAIEGGQRDLLQTGELKPQNPLGL